MVLYKSNVINMILVLTGLLATICWLLATAVSQMMVRMELRMKERKVFLCRETLWQLRLLVCVYAAIGCAFNHSEPFMCVCVCVYATIGCALKHSEPCVCVLVEAAH